MIEDEVHDDPTRDAARHIAHAGRLVATGLAGVAAAKANQRSDQDRDAAARLRTQTRLAQTAQTVRQRANRERQPER